jgi:hypothetical protein
MGIWRKLLSSPELLQGKQSARNAKRTLKTCPTPYVHPIHYVEVLNCSHPVCYAPKLVAWALALVYKGIASPAPVNFAALKTFKKGKKKRNYILTFRHWSNERMNSANHFSITALWPHIRKEDTGDVTQPRVPWVPICNRWETEGSPFPSILVYIFYFDLYQSMSIYIYLDLSISSMFMYIFDIYILCTVYLHVFLYVYLYVFFLYIYVYLMHIIMYIFM